MEVHAAAGNFNDDGVNKKSSFHVSKLGHIC